MKIQFTVCIYPSVSHRGKHTVAITNSSDESVVLGFTSDSDLEQVKHEFDQIIRSNAGWTHNEALDIHTLEVEAS